MATLASSAPSAPAGPIETLIRSKIGDALRPAVLEVFNESYKHSVPKGSESHFKVVVVSDQFEGKSPIERHRLVNHVLKDELSGSVHALSIQAMTPAQWDRDQTIRSTPNCQGGSKK